MAMTTVTAASDATSNQNNRITRDEFIQQGIDIVHAYAEVSLEAVAHANLTIILYYYLGLSLICRFPRT